MHDSVLFFSRPRSECWPHHGRTFSIYPCPLSLWLTLPRRVLSTSWCCPSGRAWPSSPTCTWHCSLHYLSPGNSLASSLCDHSMLASLLWRHPIQSTYSTPVLIIRRFLRRFSSPCRVPYRTNGGERTHGGIQRQTDRQTLRLRNTEREVLTDCVRSRLRTFSRDDFNAVTRSGRVRTPACFHSVFLNQLTYYYLVFHHPLTLSFQA